MKSSIEQLVDDALHGRRMTGSEGSCFVTNAAGSELAEYSEDIADALETKLSEIDSLAHKQPSIRRRFSGLNYVVGAYLVNTARHDVQRGVNFINKLSPHLVLEFIANIPVFFGSNDKGYNFGIPPPAAYREWAREMETSEDQEIAKTAERVVERMKN